MSFTYTNHPDASDRDLMRMLLHDTSSGSAKFSDEDLAWFVANSASIWYAAAEAADTYAAQVTAGGVSKQVGDLRIDYGSGGGGAAGEYHAMAARFRARGSRSAVPFAGGIFQSDKDAEKDSSDRVAPAFSIGMHDERGSSTGSTGY